MLAPLRRCVDGWPCMVGDLQGRRMQTASKIENPTTLSDAPSRSAFSRCGAGRITRNGGLRKRPAPKSPTLYLSHSVILYVPAPPRPAERRMNYDN